MAGDYATRMKKIVRENNPGWKSGDVFDTSLLDQLDGTLSGADFKAQECCSRFIKQAKQATNALLANNYGNELAKETETLKGQRKSDDTYNLSNKAEDYVRAFGNLYDEIAQGYQNGTRERYVEDKTFGTGYRKMTMEEELNGLDKAFQRLADGADVKEMITDEFQRLSSKAGSKQTSLTDTNKKPLVTDNGAEETVGQKMKKLAEAWKDAYKTSGSKESSMEKVLSMLNGKFGISKEA